MAQPKFHALVCGNFIQGKFQKVSDVQGEWVSRCPGDFNDEIGRFQYSYASIDEAVHSARSAFRPWRALQISERVEFLKKYQEVLKRRQDELAEAIAREVGKPLWEAKTELSAMINKVDITLTESLKFIAPFDIPKIMEKTQGICRYKPLGVMAVIGPFNFPGHLPNGHFVPALLTGNTVIFKPSEKTPLVGQFIAEFFMEAGLPAGVFNLVQGEKEVGRRLCVHEGIDGVLFTGSYEVGTRIKQDTLQQHWKLLALEMGGKNSVIVWEDAQMDLAVYEVLLGAFLTAGQRCSATSRVIVHSKRIEEFTHQLHARAKAFSIGHPLENPFMGPLIDQGSVDRYMKFLGIANREGFEWVMRGKTLEYSTSGNYVTPSICLAKECSLEYTRKSIYQQTELFAPNVAILPVSDLEEAIAQANATQFGLVASVFTQSRAIYEKCWEELEVGLVNWNKSTVGASSRLPFGGLKKSGNHFPTAVTAPLYCTYPVASLEVAEPGSVAEVASKTQGLNWEVNRKG
jgi:succinylglutamic semialdehyde dehydrogenase